MNSNESCNTTQASNPMVEEYSIFKYVQECAEIQKYQKT